MQPEPPSLEITGDEIAELARKSVIQHITIPGVQVKLSMELLRKKGTTGKLTIVGLWGNFILKPPSNQWPELPENEHCTMLLAREACIEVVPNGLNRLKSGELAYITRRIDRSPDGLKIPMEDMCQLTDRLTENKSKAISKYSQVGKSNLPKSLNLLFCRRYSNRGTSISLTPAWSG
ncbi:MAG: HipA domain-containing protein [Bacteroidetes bacterium]|nr:HipA domain-containing protein [Bacteroidota bacterium]MCH8524847.1 HipA domain-containing protein [Balneolales bacterium]